MSNLSDLLPAGASGKKATFTASGTISTGDTVILNTDGTVSVVAAIAESAGSTTTFESANVEHIGSTYMTENNKILVTYRDSGNSGYGTAVVGTVSGTSISFGTPTVYWSDFCNYNSVAYSPPTDRACVVFQGTTWGRNALLSVSGTTITVEHTENFYAATAGTMSICFHAGNERFVVAVRGISNSGYGYLYAATANNASSLNWGGANLFVAASMIYPNVQYDPVEDVIVVFYRGTSNYGYARAATLSGTSFTFGTEITFESAQTDFAVAAYDSDTNQFVVTYRDAGDSFYPQAVTIKASGTSLSSGTPVRVAAARSDNYGCVYDPINQKAIIIVEDGSDYPTAYNCTVSGTSISVPSSGFRISNTRSAGSNWGFWAVYDPDEVKVVVPQRSQDNSYYGEATVYQMPTSNALPPPKFIGIAEENIANAATGEVMLVGGISENATSEVTTTNSTVYLQADGSLSTTVTSIEAGLAFGDTTTTVEGFLVGEGSYANKSVSVATQISAPHGVAFKSDGTAMYVLNLGGTGTVPYGVAQYTLSTAWDVSTATYANKSMSSSAQDTSMRGMTFKPDGTKMYLVGSTNPDTMYEYDLSTAWDVSTASFNQTGNIDTQLSTPCGLSFKSDGTACFVSDQIDDDIHQYSLSTAWDISTLSYQSKVLDATSQEDTVQDMAMSSDGTKFFVVGVTNDTVFQYDLTTAYDLSTASYASKSLSVGSQAASPVGMAFSADGTNLYIADSVNDAIYQYSTSLTTVTTSKLLLNNG